MLQVRRHLDDLHSKRMSPYEKIELMEAIRAQVWPGPTDDDRVLESHLADKGCVFEPIVAWQPW